MTLVVGHSAAQAGLRSSVRVELVERSYSIDVGRHLLGHALSAQALLAASSVCVVSNVTVGPLLAQSVIDQVIAAGKSNCLVLLPDGEAHKTIEVLDAVFAALLANACDRKTLIIALGGGVVGDMAGFAAACYQRGIAFIQIPTTLLAMVDSSVGGKTGVNHALGKNMIGAFHQPVQVICDVETLSSLPEREFNSGLAEVIKYGAIADATFFDWLEGNMDALVARDAVSLVTTITRCCEIKAEVVAKDEREAGLRETLNFGHTFGHAIETGLGYGQWLHGEAVAAGMCMAAELSASLGLCSQPQARRLVDLIRRANLPVHGPVGLAVAEYFTHMRVDKKARSGLIRYVVLDGLGKGATRNVDDQTVVAAIQMRLPQAA